MSNNKYKLKITLIFIISTILLLFTYRSNAEVLENDVELSPGSKLTYYLNVTYDGIDRNGVESSDSNTSENYSGYIYVEDKIPDGLEFVGFVTTETGSIGAVSRNNPETSC
ncbi:MAG: hypothetical protein IJH12_00405 [Clostridia bacterium]|nr:hypothetical protein [Clostridia bacterium]